MKHNQILITITDLGIIDDLKKLGISKYVFPLKGFCVGIPNTFYIDEINEKGYIYINRILDNDSIEKLNNFALNLEQNYGKTKVQLVLKKEFSSRAPMDLKTLEQKAEDNKKDKS